MMSRIMLQQGLSREEAVQLWSEQVVECLAAVAEQWSKSVKHAIIAGSAEVERCKACLSIKRKAPTHGETDLHDELL